MCFFDFCQKSKISMFFGISAELQEFPWVLLGFLLKVQNFHVFFFGFLLKVQNFLVFFWISAVNPKNSMCVFGFLLKIKRHMDVKQL